DLDDDVALVALTHALDQTFLPARDQDGDGRRDVDIETITQSMDSLSSAWDIPGWLRVVGASYATFDQATMHTAMTDTVTVLDGVFGGAWSDDSGLMPTLLYAYEQESRGVGLDGLILDPAEAPVNLSGNNLNVNFQPGGQAVERLTIAGLKWVHYC